MNTRSDVVEAWLHCDNRAVPPVVREWMSEERLRELLAREWERNNRLTADAGFAEAFQRHFPVPGAVAGDYNNRILELDGGRHVLASIRFKGLDPQQPFVEILHRDFSLDSPAGAQQLAREVAAHYAVFAPRRIRVFDSSGMFDHPDIVFATCDFRYCAAPVQQLRQLPLPPHFDDIVLERLVDLDFYDAYAAMYHRLHAEFPHLRVVPLESRQAMTSYLNEGRLYRIVIGGCFAGVFGILAHEERFLSGYLVVEEILDAPFRGRGFAAALQRRVLEEIGDSEGVLYGHISPVNTASLRTAAKVGRVNTGGMYFIDVAGG